MFEGSTYFAESRVILPLLPDVHDFLGEVGVFSVLKGPLFKFNEAYSAHHRSLEVDFQNKACVERLPYVTSSEDVLDSSGCEITTGETKAIDVQVKK